MQPASWARPIQILKEIDITDIIEPIEKRTLGALESSMQSRVTGLSETERGNVFRLKSGPNTRILRNKVGKWRRGVSEQIIGSEDMFGEKPWVHVIKRDGGYALVEPANADAARASSAAVYEIRKSLGDVYDEVKGGGRPITQEWRSNGKLVGFVAGPARPTRASPARPATTNRTRPEFIALFGDGEKPGRRRSASSINSGSTLTSSCRSTPASSTATLRRRNHDGGRTHAATQGRRRDRRQA